MRKSIYTAILLSGCTGFLSDAQASCCPGYPIGDQMVKAEVTAKLKAGDQALDMKFTNQIHKLHVDMTRAISDFAAQNHADLNALTQAERKMKDLVLEEEYALAKKEEKIDVIRGAESSPTACSTASANLHYAGSEDEARLLSYSRADAMNKAEVGDPSQSISIARSLYHRQSVDRISENFCSEADVAEGLCDEAVEKEWQAADMSMVKSMLAQDTLTDKSVAATDQFIVSVTNPKPQGFLGKEVAEDEEGQRVLLEKRTDAARLSIAQAAFIDMAAKRSVLPKEARSSTYTTLMEERIKQANEYKEQIPGYSQPVSDEGVSWHQWMDLDIKRRHRNPDWVVSLNKNKTTAIKEIALMQAQDNYLQWENYKQLEQIRALLATLVAMRSEDHRDMQEGSKL